MTMIENLIEKRTAQERLIIAKTLIESVLDDLQPEPTLEQIKEYCRKRCLSIVDNELLEKYASAQPVAKDTNVPTNDTISKSEVCEILADIYPTDGENVVAVKEIDKAYEAIQRLPSAQPEIIRCKECKHLYDDNGCPLRTWRTHTEYDFCSYAERRTDGHEREN